MAEFLQNIPLFPLVLTVGAYQIGLWCQKKTRSALCNPLLIAVVLCISVILVTGFDPQVYQTGTSYISWLLTPATVCLAVPMYEHMQTLRSNLKAVLIGIAAGTVSSLVCIFVLCKLFQLDNVLTVSMFSKSITTAIGIGVSEVLKGNVPVTIMAIVLTGITGNIIAEKFLKFIGITHPIARGVAIGTSSHVIGTSKAMEMGETEGAMSSLAIVTSGIVTVLLAPLFSMLY